jgi:hypothetical protein
MPKPGDEMGEIGMLNFFLSTLGGMARGKDAVSAQNDAIQTQEKHGQQNLVNSSQLPKNIWPVNGKAVLEAAGVKFLGVDQDDPLFQSVELPQGWKKVGTNHDMWSDLVDEIGKVRAAIFYKAAFYDRKAHMDVVVE